MPATSLSEPVQTCEAGSPQPTIPSFTSQDQFLLCPLHHPSPAREMLQTAANAGAKARALARRLLLLVRDLLHSFDYVGYRFCPVGKGAFAVEDIPFSDRHKVIHNQVSDLAGWWQ